MPIFDLFALFGDSELKKQIQAARQEANAAAAEALEKFMESAQFDANGCVFDEAGSAGIILDKPSAGFRRAARAVNLIDYGFVGEFRVFNVYGVRDSLIDPDHPAWNSIGAHKAVCEARIVVFQRCFPGEHWEVSTTLDSETEEIDRQIEEQGAVKWISGGWR